MPDSYDGGEIRLNIKLDSGQAKTGLFLIQKDALKAGKTSGQNFLSGFDAKNSGVLIGKDVDLGLDAKKRGKKTGSTFGKTFGSAFNKQTANLGKGFGGFLGNVVGKAATSFGVGLITTAVGAGLNLIVGQFQKAAQRAREEQEAFNQRLRDAEEVTLGYSNLLARANRELHRFSDGTNNISPSLFAYRAEVDQTAAAIDAWQKIAAQGPVLDAVLDEGFAGALRLGRQYLDEHAKSVDGLRNGYQNLKDSMSGAAASARAGIFKDVQEELLPLVENLESRQKELDQLRQQFRNKNLNAHGNSFALEDRRIPELEKEIEGLIPKINSLKAHLAEAFNLPKGFFSLPLKEGSAELSVQDQLLIARSRHDEDQIKRLQDTQLEEQKITTYKKTQNLSHGAAVDLAQGFMMELRGARAEYEAQITLAKQLKSELNDQLALAQAGGKQHEIRALQDELLLEQKISEYKDANFGNYEKRAQDFVKGIQIARAAVEGLKQNKLDIQSRLEVAEAGDESDLVKSLERDLKEIDLISTYESAGYSTPDAQIKANTQLDAIAAAEREFSTKEKLAALDERRLKLKLEHAKQKGTSEDVTKFEREIEFRRKIDELIAIGLTRKEAEKTANEELALYDFQAEIDARIRKNDELVKELDAQLTLAKLRGDSTETADLEKQIRLLKQKHGFLELGQSEDDAQKSASDKIDEIDTAENIGKVRDLFKSGIKAATEGDFEDFLAGKLQGAADKMFDNAIDTLLDALLSANGPLASLFGGGGAGGGAGGLLGLIGLGGSSIAKAGGGNSDVGGLLGGLPGIFAGFFEDGGIVPKGQFAIVGERGPEIISAGASPLRVTPMNDNIAANHAAGLSPDGGGAGALQYAPINNFYGHTQDDLRRSLDERDGALKSEMPGLMDRHSFNRKRGMA